MLLSKPTLLTGFAYGCSYPSLFFDIRNDNVSRARLEELSLSYFEMAGVSRPSQERTRTSAADPADWFLEQIAFAITASGLPVHDSPEIVSREGDVLHCIAPSLNSVWEAQRNLMICLANHVRLPAQHPERAGLSKTVEFNFQRLRAHANGRLNPHRLMSAAWDEGIPLIEVSDRFIQFGLGSSGTCMDSTIHERESGMGVMTSKNKAASASVLRRIGLPAMAHAFAKSAQQAVKIAQQLKYPVVVKPSSLDGGVAVEADLRSDEEVREAFAKAAKHTREILIEKWVPGRDYRMVVLNGKLVWAVERVPGGVTGDGQSTIDKLVEIENRDPNRGPSPDLPMNLLEIDDEAIFVMARENLTPQSIPEKGQFVRMRRAANVSRGGRPVAVFDKVHPDNAALAVEAANAMWLDLAGVDLILPDIEKSWRETGGAICEVNSQPQLGGLTSAHLFPLVLKTFTRNGGKIPVCCVMGGENAQASAQSLAQAFAASCGEVGLHCLNGIMAGGELIQKGPVPVFHAGNALSWRRTVDAMVLGVWDTGILQTGLPVPYVDLLVLSGETIPKSLASSDAATPELIALALSMIAPAARSIVVAAPRADCDKDILKALEISGVAHDFVDPQDLPELARTAANKHTR